MSFDESAIQDLLETDVTDSFETEFPLHPEGDYDGVIDKVDVKAFTRTNEKTGEEETSVRATLTVLMLESDPSYKEAEKDMGMRPRIRYDLWLDVNEDLTLKGGKGNNIKLGRVREAVGQNQKGVPWNFRMLVQAPIRYRIGHKPRRDDPTQQEAVVQAVTTVGGEF